MSKPYLNYQQQIEKLTKQKGLIIDNSAYAEEKLTNIGYFSLIGGYKNPFINSSSRKYEQATTFEDIVALYDFDKSLRIVTLEYLLQVEQKIGQLIADSFCSKYGENQEYYLSESSYTEANSKQNDVRKLIKKLSWLANHDTDHPYIVHQRNKYHNVPLWVTKNALSFGQLSKMYSLLKFQQQSTVSKAYPNVSEKELIRYLNALTFFRNICAHSERLFSHHIKQQDFPDKPLHEKLGIPKKGNKYIQGKQDYFGLVIALRYLLPLQDFLAFKSNLRRVINTYTKANKRISKNDLLKMMGFPENWESLTRYKL